MTAPALVCNFLPPVSVQSLPFFAGQFLPLAVLALMAVTRPGRGGSVSALTAPPARAPGLPSRLPLPRSPMDVLRKTCPPPVWLAMVTALLGLAAAALPPALGAAGRGGASEKSTGQASRAGLKELGGLLRPRPRALDLPIDCAALAPGGKL